MTYLQFHLLFLAPPLALTGWFAWTARRHLGSRAAWAILAVPPIALAYTTPWDNYLVWRGIWWYGPDRVLATIGYVPVEEYIFFVLQPLLAGSLLYVLLARTLARDGRPPARRGTLVRAVGTLMWMGLGLVGLLLLRADATTYLGLILVWFAPVIGLMWAFQGPAIWQVRGAAVPTIALITLYLWIADRMAIALGIWSIADRFTIGVDPLGLPIEEATFFALTTVLSVCGLLLFLLPGTRVGDVAR